MVSAVAIDSQDRGYAFQRKDPPVVIFDRDVNHLSSWGHGTLLYAHGIFIEDNIQDRSLPGKSGSVDK